MSAVGQLVDFLSLTTLFQIERKWSLDKCSSLKQQRRIWSSYELVHDRHYVEKSYLAKLLVSKLTLENPKMRVPSGDYDSTADNNLIFVTYHDDQV
jgi:hypothetical protein